MAGWTADALATHLGGRLLGPGTPVLHRVRSLEHAGPEALSLCAGPKWAGALAASRAGAVLIPETLQDTPGPATRIVVADPSAALAVAVHLLHPEPVVPPRVDPTAQLGAGVHLGAEVRIGPYAILGDGVQLGDRVTIGPHVVVEDGVILGDDVRLDAQVVVHRGSRLGARVWCKASAVIGGPGFGFASDQDGHHRTPQIGGCVLEDDVEIGSGSCIDRGSLDETVIGLGTKIDNHVHIGHNVRIGRHCLLMAGVGIAGSTRVGDWVILAGQAGVSGHLSIGDHARVGAKSAVIASIAAGEDVWGMPARPHRAFLRAVATLYQLSPHVKALQRLVQREADRG